MWDQDKVDRIESTSSSQIRIFSDQIYGWRQSNAAAWTQLTAQTQIFPGNAATNNSLLGYGSSL